MKGVVLNLCLPEFANALTTKPIFNQLSLPHVFVSHRNAKSFLKSWGFCLMFNSDSMCTVNVVPITAS